MPTALINGRILTPGGFADGLAVVVEGRTIVALAPDVPVGAAVHDLRGQMLVPGFIDTQVNGGGGRLFNDDPSADTIACMAAAHRPFGTTGFLPTLITDDLAKVEQAMRAVEEAIGLGVPGVLGIHLEGPFLAPARKGAHREDLLRILADEDLPMLTSLRSGRVLLTVAPECAALDQIRALTQAGVLVSLGHSNADFAAVTAALSAGASGFTHLYNAMSQLTNRAPGMVGAAFASRTAIAGIIADGEHVHPGSLVAALNTLGPERLMLVTDAMSLAGTQATGFELQGRWIRREGNCLKDDQGTLSGSVLTMSEAVRGFAKMTGAPLEEVLHMASAVPARFLGLDARYGSIAVGKAANLVQIDENGAVIRTWINGDADS